MKLHPQVQALLEAMRELETLLKQYKADFWASNVGGAADAIAQSDAYGLRKFLRLFGGMGSLNDFVLHHDGHSLDEENDKLEKLRTKAWELANQLKGEIR